MTEATAKETAQSDDERPSLIVRRVQEEETLWQIAKETGTPVQSIREANALAGELQKGMLLLIPTR